MRSGSEQHRARAPLSRIAARPSYGLLAVWSIAVRCPCFPLPRPPVRVQSNNPKLSRLRTGLAPRLPRPARCGERWSARPMRELLRERIPAVQRAGGAAPAPPAPTIYVRCSNVSSLRTASSSARRKIASPQRQAVEPRWPRAYRASKAGPGQGYEKSSQQGYSNPERRG